MDLSILSLFFMFSSAFKVSKEQIIAAPIEQVFANILDFNTWNTWSPWTFQEPNAEVGVSGSGNNIGDIMKWEGDLIGTGEIEHISKEGNTTLVQEIRFIKPFKSRSTVQFNLEKIGENETKISWEMHGQWSWFLWFMKKQMVSMIGEDYTRGLLMFKSFVETGVVPSKTVHEEVRNIPERLYIGIRKKESIPEMQKNMGVFYTKLYETLQGKKIEIIGNPFSIYHDMNFVTQMCEYTCAVPVAEKDTFDEGDIFTETYPEHTAYTVHHTGGYEFMGNPWMAAMNYAMKKLKMNKKLSPWEEYINDTAEVEPEKLEVRIGVPVK